MVTKESSFAFGKYIFQMGRRVLTLEGALDTADVRGRPQCPGKKNGTIDTPQPKKMQLNILTISASGRVFRGLRFINLGRRFQ